MRIVVIGAHGQLGAAIVHECSPIHEVIAFTRANLDITDDRAVAETLQRAAPDVIINCAAYNDVDGAEDHPVDALNVNAFALRALARAAEASGAALVHYSTDFVFDGTASTPYTETDRPNPRSTYAASKLLGEWFAADAPRSYVLRVESLFGRAPNGPDPKGSVASIVKAIVEGREVRVFDDRTVSPTYVVDAARGTRALVERKAPSGLYHCVNTGCCTWLELAQEVARQLGVQPHLVPVHVADARLRAQRPRYCALSNERLKSVGIEMPTWQDAIGRSLTGMAAKG